MIRNYYTDSFKGGVIPVISTTQLIDGRVKAFQQVTNNTNQTVTTSDTVVLTAGNLEIKEGMQVTGAFVGGVVDDALYPIFIETILPLPSDPARVSTDNLVLSNVNNIPSAPLTAGTGYGAVTAAATTSPNGTGMTITTTVGAAAQATPWGPKQGFTTSGNTGQIPMTALLTVISAGVNYTVGTGLVTNALTGTGSGMKVSITGVNAGGGITSVIVQGYSLAQGTGYVANDTIEVSQGATASGAVINVGTNPNIQIGDVLTTSVAADSHLNGLTVNSIILGGSFSAVWSVVMSGTIAPGIQGPQGGPGVTYALTFTRTAGTGGIETGTIVAQGTGYKPGDTVTVDAPGSGGTFTVSESKSLCLATPDTSIKIGMGVSGPGIAIGTGITSINAAGDIFEISIAQAALANTRLEYSNLGTSFILSKTVSITQGTALDFTFFRRSAWNEYNLYVGTSPANFQSGVGSKVTQGIANAGTAGTTLEIKTANALVAAGQLIYDDGVLIGTVVSIAANDTTITTSAIPVVADLSVINFVNPSPASVTVTTIDDNLITFVNPAEGFVLPVSVVQVNSVANGLSGLIALN